MYLDYEEVLSDIYNNLLEPSVTGIERALYNEIIKEIEVNNEYYIAVLNNAFPVLSNLAVNGKLSSKGTEFMMKISRSVYNTSPAGIMFNHLL